MATPSDRSSMKHVVKLVAMIATFGALEAVPARAQLIDSAKTAADSAKRQADSTKADSTATKATKVSLSSAGKVDGPVALKADLSSRTLTVSGANGVIRTF